MARRSELITVRCYKCGTTGVANRRPGPVRRLLWTIDETIRVMPFTDSITQSDTLQRGAERDPIRQRLRCPKCGTKMTPSGVFKYEDHDLHDFPS